MNFRFLNIPVTIHPTFWLFLFFFCFNPQVAPWQMLLWGAVLFVSLLVHEYGHALGAQRLGKSPEITLEAFGGYASYNGGGLSEKQHFLITLLGPVFTGFLIAASYALLKNHVFEVMAVNYFLYYTMKLNTYLLIVNLAPVYPLDGAKILNYFLKRGFGAERGHGISLILGNITAVIGVVYFFIHENYAFTYLFFFHGWKNYQTFVTDYVRKKPNPFALYNEAIRVLESGEIDKAKGLFEKLARCDDAYIKIRSLEKLAYLLDQEGLSKRAYGILKKVDPEAMKEGKWLLCKLAYAEKNYSLIEKFARDIYEIAPTFETALLNAKAFSQLGNAMSSTGWLKTALQFEEAAGYGRELLLSDSAFEPVRNTSDFQEVAEKLVYIHK